MSDRPIIVIVGAGFVGLATAVALVEERDCDVLVLDGDAANVRDLNCGRVRVDEPGLEKAWCSIVEAGRARAMEWDVTGPMAPRVALEVAEAAAVVLCLPTPVGSDGHDLTLLRAAVSRLDRASVIVIRSTTAPGSAVSLAPNLAMLGHIFSIPEFLVEGRAIEGAKQPARVVGFYGPPDRDLPEILAVAFGVTDATVVTNHASAEAVKCASNVMLASRLSTWNTLALLVGATGGNLEDVKAALCSDPRIGSLYLEAGAGWGGSCLPKDVSATAGACREHRIDHSVLDGVVRANDDHIDWISRVMRNHIATHRVRSPRIAWLGVSFKPGVGDVRQSPSILSARQVWMDGVGEAFAWHDPVVRSDRLMDSLGPRVAAEAAVDGADVVVIATAWAMYPQLVLNNAHRFARGALIVDARRALDAASVADLRERGFRVVQFGGEVS